MKKTYYAIKIIKEHSIYKELKPNTYLCKYDCSDSIDTHISNLMLYTIKNNAQKDIGCFELDGCAKVVEVIVDLTINELN